MPSEFHNREPPLPFGNPKSRPWYGMDIFWNRPFLGHHFVGKPVVAMKMLAVLSGYANSCAFSLSLFTSLLACLMIQLGRHVPYSVASFQIQFITQ